uniref:PRORP domain-containing protein n=1 Tax=Parascaris univalens TaxID=6257 RepID=A0A915AKH7_PARUN
MKMIFYVMPLQLHKVATEMRCGAIVLRRFAKIAQSSALKTAPSTVGQVDAFPLVLQRLGVDWNDSLTKEGVADFRKRPIVGADTNALSALRRFRLFNSARIYADVLRSCGVVPPMVHLELCRLLAAIHLEGAEKEKDRDLLQFLQASLDDIPAPMKPTASILLTSCSTISHIPSIPSNVIERNSVVACLLGRTLRDAHVKMFTSLLRAEQGYPIFYSEAVLKLMAFCAAKTPSLAKVLLERSVAETCAPSSSIVEHFARIIRASKVWYVREKVAISPEGICSACAHKLNERDELVEEEHWVLHKAVLALLEGGSQTFSSGSPAEIRALRSHVRSLPKVEDGGKTLVVDTLNLIHGRSIEPFYKMLLALLEEFPRIMLITRPGLRGDFIRHLSTIKVSVFVCNKLSEDDLFVLLAALETGPNCYVLTNDQFSDHRSRLSTNALPLFDKWNASRIVRYFSHTFRYKMPGKFTCFPHRTPNGFHIPVARIISPSIYEHDWMCIVRKRPKK